MADFSLGDLRHVSWSETAKLAIARGLASSLVLTVSGLIFGFFRGASALQVIQFALLWPAASCIGAPIYMYMLKGISAVLTPIAGGIVATSCTILSYLVAISVACGDPLVFLLTRSAPNLLNVPDFRIFNLKVLIFVVDRGDTGGMVPSPGEPPEEWETPVAPRLEAPATQGRPSVTWAVPPEDASERISEAVEDIPNAETDEDPVREFLELCDRSPEEGLAWYINLGPELQSMPVILFGKFIAERQIAFEAFFESGASTIEDKAAAELETLFPPDRLHWAREALQTISDLEEQDPDFVPSRGSAADRFAVNMVDTVATALERLEPGSVQEILGWTKIRYFGTERIGLFPGAGDDVPRALLSAVLNRRVRFENVFRSVIVLGAGEDDSGRYVRFELLEQNYQETPTIGDAGMLGILPVYDRGVSPVRLGAAPEHAAPPPPGEWNRAWLWAPAALVGVLVLSAVFGGSRSTSPTAPSVPLPAATTEAVESRPPVLNPSFDCGRASRWDETQICSTPSLAEADRSLATLYASRVQSADGADRARLRDSQRAWLRERARCATATCLEQSFETRTAELRASAPAPAVGNPGIDQGSAALPPPPHATSITGRADIGSRRRPHAPVAEPSVTCILASGQEIRLSRADCRQRGGVLY